MDNLLIFDGTCKFCAKTVQFILRHEDDQTLLFTPLQTATGSRLMREFGINPGDAETFVLIADGDPFVKSDAAIELTRYLRRGWRLLAIFRFVPRFVRDWIYGLVARNRYRWFGRYDKCMVPSPEIRDRFIVD